MSDFTDARTAYLANADYAEDGSATKAAAYITACRQLKMLLMTETQGAENRVRADENLRQLDAEIKAAEAWQNANTSTPAVGGVIHSSFENFRDY